MRTTIVVLEELDRNPRMQAHARALAAAGDEVTLVGLAPRTAEPDRARGTEPDGEPPAELRLRTIRLRGRALATRPGGPGRLWSFGARALLQAVRLAAVLFRTPSPDTIIVRNPPAVPTLAVSWLVSRLRGARLVIDWHNLSHLEAAVRFGEGHRVVRAVARAERRWARRAHLHVAISQAMADWLRKEWGIRAVVVRDRPSAAFARPDAGTAEATWHRLASRLSIGPTRLPLIVCATTWQPEEDLDLLLEALERAERQLAAPGAGAGPDAVVLLTGRGPLREAFEARVRRRSFQRLAVRFAWIEPADYPRVLGLADLGICLHQSPSGLDLPIRLAELRACGVPVYAFDYGPVLGEALVSGREGMPFRDPGDLAGAIVAIATANLSSVPALASSREWLAAHPWNGDEQRWRSDVCAVLRGGDPGGFT